MSAAWYVSRDGQQYGPYTLEELQGLIALNKVVTTDLLWKAGMTTWAQGSTIPELFPAESPAGTRGGANKAITARCPNPSCRRQLRVAARFAGQEVQCLHCGSPIQIPRIRREGPIMMVRAMCSVNGKAFSILFRRLGVEGWVAEKAFKRSEHEADSRYEMRSLKG